MFRFTVPRPLRWLAEEAFWRDVTTRAVAGLIVVGVGYAYGRGAGTIPAPTNQNIAFDAALVVGSFAVSVLLTYLLAVLLDLRRAVPMGSMVVPVGSDPLQSMTRSPRPWWRQGLYYVAHLAVLTLPLWGTACLSILAIHLFSP